MDQRDSNLNVEDPSEMDMPYGTYASFPVDLTKEEYVAFNVTLSKATGILRFRKGQLILFGIMALFCLALTVMDIVMQQAVDPVMVLLVLFLIASGSLVFFGIPYHVKKAAGKSYDQSILNGYSYYGQVRVYADRMEKVNDKNTTQIHYKNNAIFLETKEMMILLAPGTPAIVLMARYMTEDDANGVRKAVLPVIPPMRQRLSERLMPGAKVHIEAPRYSDEPEAEEILCVPVEYTREEFVKIVTDTAGRGFLKILPLYSAMSLFAGLIFGMISGFGVGILSFLILIGILFALNVLTAKGKASRSYAMMPESGKKIQVGFSEQGISVRSSQENENLRFVWKAITRAVERPDSVEFFTETTFLRIPKRCIEDLKTLKSLVDRHIQPKSASKK